MISGTLRRGATPAVGRERELQRLISMFEATTRGLGGTAVISGVAGIGKSTLIRVFIEQTAGRSLALVGRCHDVRSGAPFEPWAQIVEGLNLAEGREVFDARVFRGQSCSDLTLIDAIHGQFLDALGVAASARPLVIVLEDLQWADSECLELIRHVSPRVDRLPILLILSYRSDEITRRNPLFTLLPAIVRDGNTKRITLPPLDDRAVGDWVDALYDIDNPDRDRLVNYVHAQSEGNPFYATEILRFLHEGGVLLSTGGEYRLGDLRTVGVPPLVQQMIETRLQRLTREDRQILNIAAVFGSEVPISKLSALTEVDGDRLLDTLARAIERGILTDSGGATVNFAHALIRETLYESVHPPERRIWHRRIAESLSQACAPDPDQVAHHFGQAGDPREAEWLILSGDRAMKMRARRAATERYERALQLLENTPGQLAERGWLLYRLGSACRLADPRRSLSYCADASKIAETLDDDGLTALVQLGRGMALCALDHPHALEELLRGNEMIERLSDADLERLRNEQALNTNVRHGNMAYWLASYGRYEEAEASANEFLTHAAKFGEIGFRGEPSAWYALAKSYAARGRADEARAAYTRAAKLFDRLGNFYSAGTSLWEDLVSVSLIFRADDPEDRAKQAASAESYWSRSGSVQLAQNPAWSQVPVLYIEGHWDEAWEQAFSTVQRDMWSMAPLVYLGRISRHRGDRADAWSRVWAGIPEGPDASPGSYTIRNIIRLQVLAVRLAFDDGNRDLAEQWLTALETWMDWSGTVASLADVELLRARLALFDGDPELACRYARDAIARAGNPREPLALLRAHSFYGKLLIEHRPEAAATHLQQALALANACRAVHEHALALTAHARLDLAAGKFARASGRALKSRQILTKLRARPALSDLAKVETRIRAMDVGYARNSRNGDLTRRQAEILWLVSEGLTDSDIAEQLQLSRRTVSNHLQSIYTKLGVTSRAAATRYAIEHNFI